MRIVGAVRREEVLSSIRIFQQLTSAACPALDVGLRFQTEPPPEISWRPGRFRGNFSVYYEAWVTDRLLWHTVFLGPAAWVRESENSSAGVRSQEFFRAGITAWI